MRRIFTLLMVLSLCVLTACGSQPDRPDVAVSYSAQSDESERSTGFYASASPKFSAPNHKAKFEIEPPFSYGVVDDLHEKTVTAEDGTVLASYRYQIPTLQVQDEDGQDLSDNSDPDVQKALKVATAFNTGTAELLSKSDFDGLIEMAKEDYSWQQETEEGFFSQYTDEMTYSIYQTDRFISVLANFYWYTGGAHGNSGTTSYNFDLENGTFFDPMAFTDDPQAMTKAVTAKLIELARERAADGDAKPEEYFWPDYADILSEWESRTVYFTEDGYHVIFASYDIACYAAGAQEFTITTDFLKPYLNDYGRAILGLPAETEG